MLWDPTSFVGWPRSFVEGDKPNLSHGSLALAGSDASQTLHTCISRLHAHHRWTGMSHKLGLHILSEAQPPLGHSLVDTPFIIVDDICCHGAADTISP